MRPRSTKDAEDKSKEKKNETRKKGLKGYTDMTICRPSYSRLVPTMQYHKHPVTLLTLSNLQYQWLKFTHALPMSYICLVVVMSNDDLYPYHKFGAHDITYKTLHFCHHTKKGYILCCLEAAYTFSYSADFITTSKGTPSFLCTLYSHSAVPTSSYQQTDYCTDHIIMTHHV